MKTHRKLWKCLTKITKKSEREIENPDKIRREKLVLRMSQNEIFVTNKKIFEEAVVENVNREKKHKILHILTKAWKQPN